MKMKTCINVFLLLTLLTTNNLLAETKISKLDFISVSGDIAKVIIRIKGELNETPELTIKNKMVQVEIPNTIVWPKIEKKISISKKYDATLMAYQYNNKMTRVRVLLPYSLRGLEDQVSLTLKNGRIELKFPQVKTDHKKRVSKFTQNIDQYDETYLDKLVKEKTIKSRGQNNKISKKFKTSSTTDKKLVDDVKLSLSGQSKMPFKKAKSSFSLTSYVGKFLAFLGVILLFFYGVVHLMKKGVIKKGKLGFLNSEKLVEVLSTTYVGPKKNVMMIRAHKQVFLVSSSDTGISLISEIDDISGLLKEGEKIIAGTNFDNDLGIAETTGKDFKLKDLDLATYESKGKIEKEKTSSLADLVSQEVVKDKVKFSEQIKSKMKKLKQLQ